MTTAIKMLERMDLRRARAQSLASAVLKAIDRQLDPENDHAQKDAYYAILEVLRQEGVEILTDYTRAEIGLPPRGPDGWTDEELRALEAARLAVMMRPITMTIDKPT